MKNILFIIFCIIGQNPTVHCENFDLESHKAFIKHVTESNLMSYKEVIEKFDGHLSKNPDDLISIIEKCHFIEAFTYAESELIYFNFINDDYEKCEAQITKFPEDHPQRILYNLSLSWNEEAIKIYTETLAKGIESWSERDKIRFYFMMHENTSWNTPRDYQYAFYGFEQTKDSKFILGTANYYLENNNKEASIELIRDYLPESDDSKIELIELLLKLGINQKASEILESIENKEDIQKSLLIKLSTSLDSQYQPSQSEWDEIQDLWNFEDTFLELYQFANKYHHNQLSQSLYQYRSSKDFWHDPFRYTKFKIFKQSHIWNWHIHDFYSVLMWLSLVLGSVLIMFVIIAPVHYRGLYRRIHKKPETISLTKWNLKHALFMGSLFILIDIVLSIVFQYQSVYSSLFLDTEVDYNTRNGLLSSMYFYSSFILLAFVLLILNKGKDLLKVSAFKLFKSILVAAAVYLVLKILIMAITTLYKMSLLSAEINLVQSTISDLKNNYGILTVYLTIALLTPILEELLFRGVLLNSFTKHISFGWANIIQASLFALIHENTQFFPFYFVIGIITGVLVKKQKHIYGAIAFHCINNAIAIATIG